MFNSIKVLKLKVASNNTTKCIMRFYLLKEDKFCEKRDKTKDVSCLILK